DFLGYFDKFLNPFFIRFRPSPVLLSMGRILKAEMRRKEETIMKRSPLPKDADELLAIAESVATTLSEYRNELGMSIEVEALLRAGIAAATFSINTYLAVLAGTKKSPVA